MIGNSAVPTRFDSCVSSSGAGGIRIRIDEVADGGRVRTGLSRAGGLSWSQLYSFADVRPARIA